MRVVLELLGLLWASPWTMVGVALVHLTGCQRRIGGGILLYDGASSRPWRWWSRRWGMAAVTIGALTICVGEPSPALLRHERRHQRQAMVLGPLYLPAYLLLCLWGPMTGRHWYRDHPLERDARAAEGDAP